MPVNIKDLEIIPEIKQFITEEDEDCYICPWCADWLEKKKVSNNLYCPSFCYCFEIMSSLSVIYIRMENSVEYFYGHVREDTVRKLNTLYITYSMPKKINDGHMIRTYNEQVFLTFDDFNFQTTHTLDKNDYPMICLYEKCELCI